MAEASIAGRDAPVDEAIAAAAKILNASRCAVVAGLGTDVAGAEAAVALARRIGATLDHSDAAAALRDLTVMREAGWIVVSMQQARALADLVLLVGPGPNGSWQSVAERMRLAAAPVLAPDRARRVIALCPSRDATAALPGIRVESVGSALAELPVLLGTIRAQCAGRRTGKLGEQAQPVSNLVGALRIAQYGVALWCASAIDELSIEMLCGLIDDLNAKTRFAGLPLAAQDNAAGVLQATCWRSGFPVRVGFGRGKPEHDPWRFDAERMIESGEADAAVWIAACSPQAPPWRRRVPLVALVAETAEFASPPDVGFHVGRPGIDHDSVLFDAYLGVLAAKPATAPRPTLRVADVLARLSEAIQGSPTC